MKISVVRAAVVAALLTLIETVLGEVIVVDSTEKDTLASIKSVSASFGRPLPEEGIHGWVVLGDPQDGCKKLRPPPNLMEKENISIIPLEGKSEVDRLQRPLPFSLYPVQYSDNNDPPPKLSWIAMVSRFGGCTFEDKVRNAQMANYSAVIVYNVNSDKIIPMGGDDSTLIPSVFIGFSDAELLAARFVWNVDKNVRIILTDDEPFDINSYLLPFAIVVGICFLIMLGIVIFKCVQDHRRNRRHRLPKSALKKLPIHKFKTGDPFDTCCICLDDFEEGDKLRVLPCDHGYHSKCIDPWLVKNKRICPQCRKKVFASNERGATLLAGPGGGSDSDEEQQTTSERAPLLRQQPAGAYGGTSTSNPTIFASALREGPLQERRRRFFARRGRRNAPPLDNGAEASSTSSSDDDDDAGVNNRSTGDSVISPQHHRQTGDVSVVFETVQSVRGDSQRHLTQCDVVIEPRPQNSETKMVIEAQTYAQECDAIASHQNPGTSSSGAWGENDQHVSAEVHSDPDVLPDVVVVLDQSSDISTSQNKTDSHEEEV